MISSDTLTLWGYSSGRQKLREANRTEILWSQDYLYKTKSSTFGAESKYSRMPAQISHAGKNADIAAALKKNQYYNQNLLHKLSSTTEMIYS